MRLEHEYSGHHRTDDVIPVFNACGVAGRWQDSHTLMVDQLSTFPDLFKKIGLSNGNRENRLGNLADG